MPNGPQHAHAGDGAHAPGRTRTDGHAHDRDEHGHIRPTGVRGWLSDFFRPHSHDAADATDLALEGSGEGIRAVKVSLVALGVTALLQLVVVWFTGSVALLADTVHNFADASTSIPLWIAFSLARRPATRRYTYGYGRAEDLAGLFVILMIAGSAIFAIWESIARLLEPQEISYPGWVLVAGVLGFAGNELVARYRISVGRRIGSGALVADGVHARTDGLTSLAVTAGAIGVMAGLARADAIVGLVISAMIIVMLLDTGRAVLRRVMDGVEPGLVDRIERVLINTPGVHGIGRTRARWIGHSLTVEAEIVVDHDASLATALAVASEVGQRLNHVPSVRQTTVRLVTAGEATAGASGQPPATHDHHLDPSRTPAGDPSS